MWDLIKEKGFINYMQEYPINPISIVMVLLIIGIIVLVVNAKVRRSKAERFRQAHPDAALVIFGKQKIGNYDYADNIRIITVNNETVEWFFYKPNVPAMYVQAGHNEVVLYAEWARKKGSRITTYKSDKHTMQIDVRVNQIYTLEYYIPEGKYVLVEKE